MKTLMVMCLAEDGRPEMCLREAAALGYRCVFCGDKANERIRGLADVCYEADWNDTEGLIRIGEKEKIDGVVALCDPAVLPAARVAAALGLPGNTTESLEVLLSKNRFRSLQESAGLFCPKHAVFQKFEEIGEALTAFRYPLIVKPLLASSSFGQTVLESETGLAEAFAAAAKVSRNGEVCGGGCVCCGRKDPVGGDAGLLAS